MNTQPPGFPAAPSAEPPDDSVFAGEYVLGVLDGARRAEAQRRLAVEPAFARHVEAWERHFASWLDAFPPADVPAQLWLRIRQRLGWAAVAPAPAPGLWRNTAFWRGATGLAAAAAIAAVYFGRAPVPTAPLPAPTTIAVQPAPAQPATPEPAARPVTVLVRDNGATAWIASIAAGHDRVLMVPVPSPADPAGRVDELWIIPQGGTPLSLGFVSNDKAHTIEIPPALRHALAVGATFAVTLEPEAGMPHAAPTGPIVAKGQLQSI